MYVPEDDAGGASLGVGTRRSDAVVVGGGKPTMVGAPGSLSGGGSASSESELQEVVGDDFSVPLPEELEGGL